MKATLNCRITHDMNISFTFTAIVDTTEEAEEFGRHSAHLVTGYTNGYAAGSHDAEADPN